ALAGGFTPAVHAQAAKGSGSAKSAKSARKEAPAAKAEDPPKAEDDGDVGNEAPEEQKTSKIEVFKDPNAEAALKVFKSVPGLRPFPARDVRAIISMAAGGALDRDMVKKFVEGMALDLTEKSNINALINPPETQNPNAAATRAIQRATDNLLDVYHTARLAGNSGFLSAYNAELLNTLPKLLDNNLVARIQAMIVLGTAGNPNAVPFFVAQLKDPNQTVWVKLWAARGLSNAAGNGAKVDAVGGQMIEVARALSEFLDRESDPPLPWPVQMRALEALGSMRVASSPSGAKAEMATTAMKFLADPEARPEVRAQAAWALGMLRVNQTVRGYNYALIAYDTGQVAAELGEQINASFKDKDRALSEYLTSFLVTPIYQAFNGLDGARESGLLKVPGGYPTLPYARQVSDLSAAVAKAAVEGKPGAAGAAGR
ncbi:MAG: hypothetical protein LC745_12970, partial [Planctomycetia bacterium]|nr:hypothetical protein [Planctomycetia bacterium]